MNASALAATRALLAAVLLAALSLAAPARAQPETYAVADATLAEIDGAIGPATAHLLDEALAVSAREPGGLLILRLDTPGGLYDTTRDIVETILAAPVPVLVFVGPAGARAASAGTFVLYASHVAAMAPSTTLGAATPVAMGGADTEDLRRKRTNDAAATLVELATLRGRNADFAERAVREAATLGAADAVQDGVAEILASDPAAALREADGLVVRLADRTVRLATADATITVHEPGLLTRVLSVLADPNVAYILLLVGIYGLIFEFANPGTVFSGVIGAVSLLLGLYAMNLMPIDVTGALLLTLGVALMVAEAFVPSFGILGIGGAAAFAFGSLMLFDGDVPGLRLSPVVVALATLSTALVAGVVLAAAVRALRRPPASGDRALVHEIGRVVSWEGFAGDIEVHGERWRARADEPLAVGEPVRIVTRDGLTLHVRRAPESLRPPVAATRSAP